MSTMLIVVHLLVGHGHHHHWKETYAWQGTPMQSMLCEAHAKHMRDVAEPGKGQRINIWCQTEAPSA